MSQTEMKFVCESLHSFRKLNENMEQAKKAFAAEGFDENSDKWKEFINIFGGDPEFMGKFAEWILADKDEQRRDEALEDIQEIYKEAKENKLKLDPGSFISLRDFEKKAPKLIQTQKDLVRAELHKKEIEDIKSGATKEREKIDAKIGNPKTAIKTSAFVKKDPTVFGDRVWVYGVLIKTRNKTFVKFGDHRDEKSEGAIKYAMDQTVGKARGIVGNELEDADIKLIFCIDVTDYALQVDPQYLRPEKKGFDNLLRPSMPGDRQVFKNKSGGVSLELHEHDINQSDSDIKDEWIKAINDITTGKNTPLHKPYEARKFHEEMNEKISEKKSDKYLLGAATGSGKEVITLSTLIHIHDERSELFDKNTIHVSCATIPSTELELFEELANVSGVELKSKKVIEFSRIKAYTPSSFAKSYKDLLKPQTLIWFNKNVTVVDKISDIPSHSGQEVPVLFGSFQDIGLKASNGDKTERYDELGNRIGILSIGEGHQFLSNINNKLWIAIKEKYKFKFLLLISGTPYDFIFNESSHLYFNPEERTLFTRNDLYEAKRNGDPAFQKFPEFNYYQLDFSDFIERIKQLPGWTPEEGFTYEKLFDRNKGEFVYPDSIISFFTRLFSTDIKGKRDPLSIDKAPGLCKAAKRHILIALPTGTKESSVSDYIPKLVKLLEDNDGLGNYDALVAYEDNLGEIKKKIDEDKKPTVTFTCRKLLTGTNIPQWGSLILLRPIGDSIKFFEQATGRIGRASEDKPNVGVFLGDIDNAVNIHVKVDEKLSSERKENLSYTNIVKRTFDNYNFFGSKNGEWTHLDMPDLVRLTEEASQNTDYGLSLCLNNPVPPENFDLEFKAPSQSKTEKVTINSQGNEGAKNSETLERVKQLSLEFEAAKDKEKWYRDMIKTHIPKMVIICLLKNLDTIQKCGDLIKKAIKNNDTEILNMIGKGVDLIPKYIDDPKQIDINYINRWVGKVLDLSQSTNKKGIEGYEERYDIINNRLDIKKLSSSLIFDPIKLSDEICEKIKNPLQKANRILVIEKNGSFSYSILKEIGYQNVKKLTIIVLDSLSQEIIKYIFKELIDIKLIKDINEIESMPKFDVIVGNPPYQNPGKTRGEKLWYRFIKSGIEALKEGGYFSLCTPNTWLAGGVNTGSWGVLEDVFKKYQLVYTKLRNKDKYFPGMGVEIGYWVLEKTPAYKNSIFVFTDEEIPINLKEYKYLSPDREYISTQIIKKVLMGDNPKYEIFGFDKTITPGSVEEKKEYSKEFPNKHWLFGNKSADNATFTFLNFHNTPKIEFPKILIKYGTRYWQPYFDEEGVGVVAQGMGIKIKDNWNYDGFKSVFEGKLFTFINQNLQLNFTGFMKANIFRDLPYIDLSKKWTDDQLYDMFHLTSEEKEFINSKVK